MDYQHCVRSCLRLVEALDQSNAWRLPTAQRQQYAERIAALATQLELEAGEALLATMLTYYHTEHALVEALADAKHPDHPAVWRQVEGQVRSLLASKLAGRAPSDSAVGLDDLTQEAVSDLWRGLRHFRYQSRLQTWVFTVASHCLNRALRAHRAQKRASMAQAQSLEALTETLGDSLPDQHAVAPETVVQGRELSNLLRDVLACHPDRRLAMILQLWAVEDHSLREIGARMRLSVGRVHGLLAQAQALLRAHPSLQAWAGLGPASALSVGEAAPTPEADSTQGEHPGGVGLYM